jgi:hypothetical protein
MHSRLEGMRLVPLVDIRKAEMNKVRNEEKKYLVEYLNKKVKDEVRACLLIIDEMYKNE